MKSPRLRKSVLRWTAISERSPVDLCRQFGDDPAYENSGISKVRHVSGSVSKTNMLPQDKADVIAKAQHSAANARRTIDALIHALRAAKARPEDPHAVRIVADLKVRLHAAEAVIAKGLQLSAHDTASTEALLTIAAGKVLASEINILAAEKLFELSGSLDGFAALDPDDALHEPLRWTFHAIGDVVVNGAQSPHHPRL